MMLWQMYLLSKKNGSHFRYLYVKFQQCSLFTSAEAHVWCMDELGVLTQRLGIQSWLQHASRWETDGSGGTNWNKQLEVNLNPSLPRILHLFFSFETLDWDEMKYSKL